ncbi:MAG: nucleoside diphosphate kinase regulator [Candidatus Omnitrophota bacterium]|jgi:regulator of nucleoside diphosphate kinase
MANRSIYITDNDMRRLRELIIVAREFGKEDEIYLQKLENELDKGKVVKSQEVPSNVITMNSEVYLRDLNTKEKITYRLVFPYLADADKGWVSILAPIGTALLGYSVGDIVEWKVPAGAAKLKVEKILYQPEAVGDYHS